MKQTLSPQEASSHASYSELQKYPLLTNYKQESLWNETLMFHMEGALLKSSSIFPYFMLVAFEAGSPLRAFILLLLYPFICLVGEEMGLKIMVFVSFVGIKAESFRIGRAVLPKFFLEDVGYEGFDMVKRSCGTKIGVSDLPRVMVDGFLRHYLGIEVVVGRDLKVVGGYFVGLMEAKITSDQFVLNKIHSEEPKEHGVIGFCCLNKSFDQHLLSHCKAIYLVSEAEKKTWQILPRKKYPKPLIFHDGRLAFRPTPLATLAMFIWFPFGFILFLIRSILGMLLPYTLSIPILFLTGMRGTIVKPKSFTSQLNSEGQSRGTLYVCNHRTLFDPICARSLAIMKPLTAVTYSLSRISELFSPIKTVRLTRNRDKDFKLIQDSLSEGDLVMCPEGTTCREPYLLRFSPMFAELTDNIVPMAINTQVSIFYATTASGFKCLDPLFLLMNPVVTFTIRILERLPRSLTYQHGEKSKFEVANHVQAQIAKALDFECTSLTRKDKYIFLADNEGVI